MQQLACRTGSVALRACRSAVAVAGRATLRPAAALQTRQLGGSSFVGGQWASRPARLAQVGVRPPAPPRSLKVAAIAWYDTVGCAEADKTETGGTAHTAAAAAAACGSAALVLPSCSSLSSSLAHAASGPRPSPWA